MTPYSRLGHHLRLGISLLGIPPLSNNTHISYNDTKKLKTNNICIINFSYRSSTRCWAICSLQTLKTIRDRIVKEPLKIYFDSGWTSYLLVRVLIIITLLDVTRIFTRVKINKKILFFFIIIILLLLVTSANQLKFPQKSRKKRQIILIVF